MNKRQKYKQKNNQQGFTLEELMITMAIIVIFASTALPFYQDYTKKAQLTAVLGELTHAARGYKLAIDRRETPSDNPNDAGYIGVASGVGSEDSVCNIELTSRTTLWCTVNTEPFKGAIIQFEYKPRQNPPWKCAFSVLMPVEHREYIKGTRHEICS